MATQSGVRAGKAFIELSLDDKLSQGIRAAQAKLQRFGSSITSIGAKITAMGSALAAPFVIGTKQFITLGDQLAKMSQRTGLSVKALSELKFAAEQGGSSIESIEKAVRAMQRTLYDASRGLTTATDLFTDLELTYEGLRKLSPEQQFLKLAEALANIENESRRAGIAAKLFGRSGTEMLPMLADGAKGLAELRAQAHLVGAAMDDIDAASAANLTDAINELRTSWRALMIQIGAAGADQLAKILRIFTESIVKGSQWVRANRELVVTIAAVSASVVGLGVSVAVFGQAVVALAASLSILSAATVVFTPAGAVALGIGALVALSMDWKSVIEDVSKALGGIKDSLAAGDIEQATRIASETFKVIWLEALQAVKAAIIEIYETLSFKVPLEGKLGKALNDLRETLIPISGVIDQLIPKLEGLGKTRLEEARAELERLTKAAADAAEEARNAGGDDTPEAVPVTGRIADAIRSASEAGRTGMNWLQSQWDSVTQLAEQYNSQLLQAKKLWEDTRTPVERFQAELIRLQGLFRGGFIDKDLFERGIEKAKELIQSTDLSDFASIQLDRGPLLGGQRAEQVFIAETREDKQAKVAEKQLKKLEEIAKNTKQNPTLAFQ